MTNRQQYSNQSYYNPRYSNEGTGAGMWRCGSWREDKGKIKI